MKFGTIKTVSSVFLTFLFVIGTLFTTSVYAKDRIKVGVVSFLTGPAGGPFGIGVVQFVRCACLVGRFPELWCFCHLSSSYSQVIGKGEITASLLGTQ